MNTQFKNLRILDRQTLYARAGPDPPPPKHRWWTDALSQGPPRKNFLAIKLSKRINNEVTNDENV